VELLEKKDLEKLIEFGVDSLIRVRMVHTLAPDSQLIQIDKFDNLPGVDVATVSLDELRNRIVKRIFDLFASVTFTVLVLSWLIPIVALFIKLDSKGPVFFIQKRTGRNNKAFGCIKFRSMVVNVEADTKQATRGDARITKVGAFLRKSSIDELPQFLNVIKGEMSLIGPRPHPISLNEKFTVYITKLMSRHYVKPGITGLAQCMGYRGETKDITDMENRYRLDRQYIENWTFWLDLKIIYLTVLSLIRGSENAF
jgi:exopolysaccharide biosynthesis polyprenyl glycosylphosphotransferase